MDLLVLPRSANKTTVSFPDKEGLLLHSFLFAHPGRV